MSTRKEEARKLSSSTSGSGGGGAGDSNNAVDLATMGKENLTMGNPSERHLEASATNDDESLCYECKRPLASSPELINVMGQPRRRWHPNCFKCTVCREPMDKRQSCHVLEDQVMCHVDYLRLKRESGGGGGIKCARCRWPIGASDWVRKAAQHVYHLACFNCDICSRQLNTGEQFIIEPTAAEHRTTSQPPSDENNNNNNSNSNDQAGPIRLLCRLHFTIDPNRQRSTNERRFENVEDLKSAEDEAEPQERSGRRQNRRGLEFLNTLALPSTSASHPHPHQGTSIIAHPDHQAPVSGPGNFHLAATTSIGKDLSIVTACNEVMQQQQQLLSSANVSPSSNNTSLLGCGGGDSPTGGPLTPTGSQTGSGAGGSSVGLSAASKSKRVRTTFTEDQLSILQTHFQIDSNPDGQDLERIATITGLSKRVTQVWFQNSRARQKKYMIKRKPPGMHGPASMHHGHGQLSSAMDLAVGDDDDDDSSTAGHQHLKTFDELTHFHRGSLFVAGLEQLQRSRELAASVCAEQTMAAAAPTWHGGLTDERKSSPSVHVNGPRPEDELSCERATPSTSTSSTGSTASEDMAAGSPDASRPA